MKGDLHEALERYLRLQWPHASGLQVINLSRIRGGYSRKIWSLDAVWEEDGQRYSQGMVLRPSYSTLFTGTPFTLEREVRIMQSLKGSPIPVPAVLWYETDPGWLGEPFAIIERVKGQADFVFPSEAEKEQVIDRFVELLAIQHRLDWEKLGLSFLGVPKDASDCALQQVLVWERAIRENLLEPLPIVTEVISWLKRYAPAVVSRVSLNQGDVGPGNFLFDGGEITAVLDWENAFLGDPMADLGYLTLWRGPALGDLGRFFARYEKVSGIPVRPESIHYYTLFGLLFGLGTGLVVRRKFCTGEAEDAIAGLLLGVRTTELQQALAFDQLLKAQGC